MLDLSYIVENLETVRENCENRGVSADLDRLALLDGQRRELMHAGDELRHQQKETSSQIPKCQDPDEKQRLIAAGKEFREQVNVNEQQLKEIVTELTGIQTIIPNMTHPDSPISRTEEGNKVLRQVGEKPAFDFQPLDHVELAEKLDLIDFEAGSKVAGHGFYFLKNEAVMLELALVQFTIEKLRQEGFTLYTTPDLARDDVLQGTGFQPRGPETQIYSIHETDLSLIATAEITLGGILKDQIVPIEDLPIKFAGISHCFRTEAGAYGKATRGIYRVHQFTKVEMFGFTAPTLEASNAFHAELLRLEEEIFQELEVPYQVLDICTGDLGGPAYRKYDLEAWMPGRGDEGSYGEVTSTSNCTDYQSRRLKIRCKSADKKGTELVHTLNGTAVAVSRALIAILENHQQTDGSVMVPAALQKWVGTDVIRPKN